jgi:hypothetical protein
VLLGAGGKQNSVRPGSRRTRAAWLAGVTKGTQRARSGVANPEPHRSCASGPLGETSRLLGPVTPASDLRLP